jgi:hypothetical protein
MLLLIDSFDKIVELLKLLAVQRFAQSEGKAKDLIKHFYSDRSIL